MHVLVLSGERVEVHIALSRLAVGEAVGDRIEHRPHVVQGGFEGGERQVPASIVMHGHGIVKRVGVCEDRLALVQVTQDPVLLEPSQMTDLPQQGIDDVELGTHELFGRQAFYELQAARSGVSNGENQVSSGMLGWHG